MTELASGIVLPPRRAVYAGSFDPPTIGHMNVIEQGVALFDELHVAIGVNPTKKPAMFDVDERLAMLADSTQGLPNVTLGQFEGMYLVKYAAAHGFTHLLRGLRSTTDLAVELDIQAINRDIDSSIATAYVTCPPDLAKVSSSQVKGLVGYEDWEEAAAPYVSPLVLTALARVCAERER